MLTLPRRALAGAGTALLLLAGGAPPTGAAPRPDLGAGDATGTTGAGASLAVEFVSPQERGLLQTAGRGSWRVGGGALRLRSTGPGGAARDPRALLDLPVTGDDWRLQVAARTRRAPEAGFSVVFAARGASYAYAHLDRVRSRSGLYVVRGGERRRVGGLAARATPGRQQVVEVRRVDGATKVYVTGQDGRSRFAGGVRATGAALLERASAPETPVGGVGSWGTDVDVDWIRASVLESTGTPVVTTPTTPGPATTPVTPGAPTTPTTPGEPTGPGPVDVDPPGLLSPPPGGRAVGVATSAELTAALADARPGDVITMADGDYTTRGRQATLAIGGKRYYGTFVGERSGTPELPIVLQGGRGAVVDGGPGTDATGSQYGVYLAGVSSWRLRGFTVRNVAKGVVLDRTQRSTVELLHVHTTGQEAIHLRALSSDNVVRANVVSDTGLTNATYGEGIYVGSASSNWGTYSEGAPDASDRNQVLDNTITRTSAENMDIKEGTTGGVIRGNRMDGADQSGSWADSWIDVKGNGWLVEGNTGTNALLDGFQVHVALSGWGRDNVFRVNTTTVNAAGYGFWLQKGAVGNVVSCDNVVTGAAAGFANVPCT